MAAEIHLTRRGLLGGTGAVLGGALLGPLAGAPSAASAQAAPRVYTRSEWLARPPTSAATVLDRAPDHIVVHHTATPNSTDYSLNHAFALSRSIQNYHMDGNGWADTGQQLTISRGGHLMEGRNRSLSAINAGDHVVGAQTGGHNSHTIGIENEGNYMTAAPTGSLWSALVATCAWLCDVYGLDPHAAIVGHRDYNATACPGDVLYARLPQLRNEVAGSIGARRVTQSSPAVPSGLPGPRHAFDHGPALSSGERIR
ncbi:N-acetylmuramoyl-L-alanine amidase [Actinomadura sp. GC306]|uniref:peptidoglycan recognition protein family protein n=1 Tax=Actinomadura sp. GC306 TaxID=2530367 RepID=UPI0010461AA2|nr:peptidoglycan recognition family protein [Actinomadura sp. GC306]TDC64268.1 N-acetylmuramoyl-L-alanine amidase [Actinomadura sp. GC306]